MIRGTFLMTAAALIVASHAAVASDPVDCHGRQLHVPVGSPCYGSTVADTRSRTRICVDADSGWICV